MSSITACSKDITREILAYLDVKSLGRAEQVCTQWKIYSDDNLWQGVFSRIFSFAVPKNMSGKEAMFKYGASPVKDRIELFKRYVSFRCNLTLGKTKEFKCCTTNNETLFSVKESFSSECKEVADETEICKLEESGLNFFLMGTLFAISGSPLNQLVSLKLNDADTFVQVTILDSMLALFDKNNFTSIRLNNDAFQSIVVKGVDVGKGNVLGYYSDVNNRKTPFKFSCVNGAWLGRMPPAGEVFTRSRFAKIGPKGEVTWEKADNRFCDSNGWMVRNQCWDSDLFSPDAYWSESNSWDSWSFDASDSYWDRYFKAYPIEF
jgi:F-box domain